MSTRLNWTQLAELLRTVLEQLGVVVDLCLPGEPKSCGHDATAHCVSYLAALQAKAEDSLRAIAEGDPDAQGEINTVLDWWREQFAEDTPSAERR